MAYKILFTGTTSARKSTVLNYLKNSRISNVLFIPEIAREILSKSLELEKDPHLQDILFAEQTEEKEGKRLFEAGFATQALSENLGFQFTPDGSFHSEVGNCIVVTNGQSRGIGLEQFQTKCEFMAARLYGETESRREIIFGGKEGQRINREREF